MATITLNPHMTWDTKANWQVVFKLNGKDYCRETRPAEHTEQEVRAWAEEQCKQHRLDGADLQRF